MVTPQYVRALEAEAYNEKRYKGKRIGYALQDCLVMYQSQYPRPFENFYEFIDIRCDKEISDFEGVKRDITGVL
jgi:hypothetical protein